MATQFLVPTKFSVVDNLTPFFPKAAGAVTKFSTVANAAIKSAFPSGGIVSKFFNSFAGQVAIGSLAAKGIEKAFGTIKTAIAGIPEFASRADGISKTGAKIGIATDTLQKYRYAGDLAGVSNETLNNAFMTLNRNLGTGTLAASMGKIDKALTAQIAKTPGADAAFRTIAAAVSAETDATKRAAMMNAAFGKSGAQLIPMLGDLSEQLKNASAYGNIIPPDAITNAELFNDTVSRVKSMMQGFGDIIRGAVLEYVTPLVIKLQDWIAANRKLIETRIEEFISAAASAVEWFIPKLEAAYQFLVDWGPAILAIAAGFEMWKTTTAVIQGVTLAFDALKAAQEAAAATLQAAQAAVAAATAAGTTATAAQIAAVKAAEAAQHGLNMAMKANIIGLIVGLVAALVAGFIMLAKKVGGVGNAFKVVGQTFMKWILIPVNLVIDYIQTVATVAGAVIPTVVAGFKTVGQTIMKWILIPVNLVMEALKGVLTAISKIPKAGDFAKGALEAVSGFQNNMNTALTGSESTILNSGFSALADPAKSFAAGGFGRAEREAGATAAAAFNSRLGGFQDAMNTALTGSKSTLSNSGPGFLADPYQGARRAELARQRLAEDTSGITGSPAAERYRPERAAGEQARLDAAAKAVGGKGDTMAETNGLIRQLLEEEKKNTAAVEGLGEASAQGVPGRLSYSQMGKEDIWAIARAGV